MGNASFVQSSFLGGAWSPLAQGRVHDPAYKTALSVCFNAAPNEKGSWRRRTGTRWLTHTRRGWYAVLRAFDFSITQPYQMEFSPGFLRFFAGMTPVKTGDADVYVSTVTADNPAKVILAGPVPAGWANGDYAVFNLNSSPCSAPLLCNRQFQIESVDSQSFTLYDAVSGAPIDGAALNYAQGANLDTVSKIFELTTPYGQGDLGALRTVQNETAVLVLHKDYQPRAVSAGIAPAPFQIAAQDFTDGPWLDINTTATSLGFTAAAVGTTTPVTASATDGINGGDGFKSTDVGRLIRIQCGPPLWDSSTTYRKNRKIAGSDSNVYVALAPNTNRDPTIDDATYWRLDTSTVHWAWFRIATVADSTHVTATVEASTNGQSSDVLIIGDGNIRAEVGESGYPQLDAQLSDIDFTQYFAVGDGAQISNGAFSNGTVSGDISGSYTVRGVWNDSDNNRSLLSFTDSDGQSASWSTVGGMADSRTPYFSPSVASALTGAGTTVWRLGLYSDTTGWPACGAYHEGRLWLSGAASNRIDASVSNDPFNFTPTDSDGTIADDNAIAAIANAVDVNVIFWMLTTADGLVLGTQAGEWLVKASSLDDPISPSSIQMRRVTTFGCANIEPVQAWSKTLFVQRQTRQLIEHGLHPWLGKYQGDNLAMLADHIAAPGIAELRWQQQPCLAAWMRLGDGTLAGVSYKNILLDDAKSYHAWHNHALGSGREIQSISTGPSFDGLSDSLYLVSNETRTGEPDLGVHWVELTMPPFDTASLDWQAWHLDEAIMPCCTELYGSGPDGIRCYGLTYAESKTVTAFIGGMDLGDYTVANGHIDVPFTAAFTYAYFQSLAGTGYGVYGGDGVLAVSTQVSPAIPGEALLALVGADTPVGYNAFGGFCFQNLTANRVLQRETGTLTGSTGLKLFDATTGAELAQATETDIFGAGPAHTFVNVSGCFHAGANAFLAPIDGGNSSPIACIDAATLTLRSIVGTSGSNLGQSGGTYILASFDMCAASDENGNNYLVSCGITSAGAEKEIAVLAIGADYMALLYAFDIDELAARVCQGAAKERASFYALGRAFYDGDTAAIGFYEFFVTGSASAYVGDAIAHQASNIYVTRRKIGTLAPAQLDPEWTTWTPYGPGFDAADGNLLFLAYTLDAVTQTAYLFKINAASGALIWKSGVSTSVVTNVDLTRCAIAGTLAVYDDSLTPNAVQIFDLSTGTVAQTQEWNLGLEMGTQFFDGLSGAITMKGAYQNISGPVPTYLGDYLAQHGDALPAYSWLRMFTGAPHNETAVTEVPFFGEIGFCYTSQGQLLRPDFGPDAGTQNGPAFGKKRRVHWWSADFYRAFGVSVGTGFTATHPVKFASPGGVSFAPPALYSGIVSDTVENDYSFDGQIAWQIVRPWPCTVTAVGGYLEGIDK